MGKLLGAIVGASAILFVISLVKSGYEMVEPHIKSAMYETQEFLRADYTFVEPDPQDPMVRAIYRSVDLLPELFYSAGADSIAGGVKVYAFMDKEVRHYKDGKHHTKVIDVWRQIDDPNIPIVGAQLYDVQERENNILLIVLMVYVMNLEDHERATKEGWKIRPYRAATFKAAFAFERDAQGQPDKLSFVHLTQGYDSVALRNLPGKQGEKDFQDLTFLDIRAFDQWGLFPKGNWENSDKERALQHNKRDFSPQGR